MTALARSLDVRSRQLALVVLLFILVLASCARLSNLIPVERGLLARQDYDEGVWDTTAQLWLQGYMPYRDFFATLPPVGIYLLASVLRLVYVPWGSGLGLMATRYASVVYGLTTIALVYRLGRRLGGTMTGLVAAAVLAVDAMVIGVDRLAMLEPPLNLFSVLAVSTYVFAFEKGPGERQGLGWGGATGVLCALAALSKTPALTVMLALVTISLLRRRWQEVVVMAVGFALAWTALSAPFLLRCPDQFLRQVYLFQLLRPADGVLNRMTRFYQLWHSTGAWTTVRLGVAGSLCVVLVAARRIEAGGWWIVVAWAGYTLLLIVANRSYFPQYYAQLAVPLSLLAGGLCDARISSILKAILTSERLPRLSGAAGWLPLLTATIIGLSSGALVRQYHDVVCLVAQTDATYVQVADALRQQSSPHAQVLAFEPNYTFLSSRRPAGEQATRFFVDTYGGMLYTNLGIESQPLSQLTRGALDSTRPELQATFWRQPAQHAALASFEQADFVVLDGRARYQLRPQTLLAIQAQSAQLFSFGIAGVRRREQ